MIGSTAYAALLAHRSTLLHLVWASDKAKLESILSNGLTRETSSYSGFWESRPGHVYLAEPRTVRKLLSNENEGRDASWALLRIDPARLDRRKVNPDEDHFLTQLITMSDNTQDFHGDNFIAGKHVCSHFHREFPPSKWLWEWAEYLKLAPLPSLGEWADAVDLGSDEREALYSMSKGSIAYDGTVPPDALTVIRATHEFEVAR
jgi:hypothetical protein